MTSGGRFRNSGSPKRVLAPNFNVALLSGTAMEPEPALPESATRSAKRGRFSKLQIAGFVSAILLLAVIVVLVFTSLSSSKVEWLTPAQFSRRTQPGPFTTFKQKVRNLAAPVWGHFRRAPSQITINSTLLTCSSTAAERIALGTPATTNANGMRAWILTSAESSTLLQQFKTNFGAVLLGSPGIMTLNGGQARVVVAGNAAAAVPGTGVTIDLIPKIVSGSVKLTMAATSIENAVPSGNSQSVKTNFAVACQAVIPNGGSLILDDGPPKDGSANRYWLIISPRVWNPVDKPTK